MTSFYSSNREIPLIFVILCTYKTALCRGGPAVWGRVCTRVPQIQPRPHIDFCEFWTARVQSVHTVQTQAHDPPTIKNWTNQSFLGFKNQKIVKNRSKNFAKKNANFGKKKFSKKFVAEGFSKFFILQNANEWNFLYGPPGGGGGAVFSEPRKKCQVRKVNPRWPLFEKNTFFATL